MFLILATKSLNDGTRGFRFNVLGQKGILRLRKKKNTGWHIVRDDCMTAVHMGRLVTYLEHKRKPERKLRHFAG